MDVRELIFVASSPEDQEDPEGVLELKRTLSLICKEQLASENILRAVQVSMEKKLLEELKSWEKRGIDSPHSLVRRFLWVVARHCNLRVKKLHENHPKLSWDAAEAKAAVIRSFKCPKKTNEDTDSHHTDPLRLKHRQPCDPSADLPCKAESTSTCTSTPGGSTMDSDSVCCHQPANLEGVESIDQQQQANFTTMGPMGLFDSFPYLITLYSRLLRDEYLPSFQCTKSCAGLLANLFPGTITRSTGPHRLNPKNSFLY